MAFCLSATIHTPSPAPTPLFYVACSWSAQDLGPIRSGFLCYSIVGANFKCKVSPRGYFPQHTITLSSFFPFWPILPYFVVWFYGKRSCVNVAGPPVTLVSAYCSFQGLSKPLAFFALACLTSHLAISAGVVFSLAYASQSIQYVCRKLNFTVNMLKA